MNEASNIHTNGTVAVTALMLNPVYTAPSSHRLFVLDLVSIEDPLAQHAVLQEGQYQNGNEEYKG
jgi:hypothetical protein